MNFIDDLYDRYRNHLTGEEEDASIIINGILQEFNDNDIKKLVTTMSDQERFEMLTLFLFEKFRLKMAEEGIDQFENQEDLKFYH
ncbi:DUF6154 family protein [Halalkalibacter kiskunsagensis]|uniref:DUF6154 family protein n=1 Tax=Halalkalibacter kiskunsagensis TaxID=1548599 RepID=A0ABV6KHJ4_9BACI